MPYTCDACGLQTDSLHDDLCDSCYESSVHAAAEREREARNRAATGDRTAVDELNRLRKGKAPPIVDVSADGLLDVLRAMPDPQWEIRYTVRAEVRRGANAEWKPCRGLTRDLFLEDCARHAAMMRGRGIVPWRPSVALRSQIVNAAAYQNRVQTDAPADEVEAAIFRVIDFGILKDGVSLFEAAKVAGITNAYEKGRLSDRETEASVRSAMEKRGWKRKGKRVDGKPTYKWIRPKCSM